MQTFTKDQKLALLDKADQEGYDIGITGSYTMTGTLNREALENDLDTDHLDSPINWDMEEVIDYSPNSITYDVGDGTTLKENMSETKMFNYLNDLFKLF